MNTESFNNAPTPSVGYKFNQHFNYKMLCVLLIIVIVALIFIWKPWQPNIKANDRTISVTGTATITASPDQFVFSPTYEFTNSNQQTALSELSQKSDAITNHLKALGVSSIDIKTNSSGYGNEGIYLPVDNGSNNYSLNIQITVHSLTLAQKVQDYLVNTSPTGQVSPNASFSTALQQQLQTQARQKAEQNARSQADQSAKNLGFSVAAVKSVSDGNFNTPIPFLGAANAPTAVTSPRAQLSVQPGQNDYTYSVSVVYYIK